MSVLVSKRRLSKYESITFSEEIHDMMIDLAQRNFGIKDVDQIVRSKYAHGRIKNEDFDYYRTLLNTYKSRVEQTSSLLTANLRAAHSIYPTSMEEYHRKRNFHDNGIANCNQLKLALQQVVEIFDVDVNLYARHIKAIDREIDLIKDWRQRCNVEKRYVKGNI